MTSHQYGGGGGGGGGGGMPPHLGASYYPGQGDDYYMPVVSPLPQRNQPQMPENIAQNLSKLELDGPPASIAADSPHLDSMHSQGSRTDSGLRPSPSPNPGARSPATVPEEEPSFSPFPPVRNRKLNVPPSDEEKQDILENAREAVLNSNDPEMQLAWAQDALGWVETSVQNEQRLADFRTSRPQTPKVERRLRVDAVNVVDFLAQQHHPKAEFLRGTWLEFGRFGFEMDKREAFRCYSRSAQNGYSRAQYRMGMQFESSSELDKAIKHYNLGLQAGDPAASYRMGMMALLGQSGQPQNFDHALELIRYSAEHADENAPQGAYVYGMLHIRELHQVQVPDHLLPFNVEAARMNIEKSAYLGFAKAQVKMGSAYELSELECEFDPVLSLHYNNLAARQGEADAEMAISKWFLSGYEGIFPKNEAMSFAYAQRAASSGLPTAEFAMGYFYEVGIHVQTSLKEARNWYSKAADHGNKDAAGRIDGISRSKTLSRKDHDRIAMARIKSQRGTRQHAPTPSIEMPQIPEFGQSYAPPNSYGGPSGPPGGPQSMGHPYGAPSEYPPQRRPNYGALAPPGAGYAGPMRPNSAGGPGPPDPYGRPGPGSNMSSPGQAYASQFPSAQAPRPVSSGYPPGYLPPPNPAQGRMPSGPTASNRIPAGPSAPAQGPPRPSPSPLPDIGFTAPPDLGGADRKRLQRPGQNQPRPGGGAPPGPSANARPPRVESLVQQGPPKMQAAPTPPINLQHGPSKPPTSKPTGGKPAAGGAAPKPTGNAPPPRHHPGKGPATFEEMGVPAKKKKDDCIVM